MIFSTGCDARLPCKCAASTQPEPTTLGAWKGERVSERVGTWIQGILAAIAGLTITFWADHSPAAGSLVFGLWALAAGAVELAWGVRSRSARTAIAAGVVTVVAGVAALAVPLTSRTLALLLALWALATLALRVPVWRAARRDGMSETGGFLIVLAGCFAGVELISGDNSVVVVGLLGAYLVVSAVWQLIGAASPRLAVSGETRGQNAK